MNVIITYLFVVGLIKSA